MMALGATALVFATVYCQPNASFFETPAVAYVVKMTYGGYVYHLAGVNLAFSLTGNLMDEDSSPLFTKLVTLLLTIARSAVYYALFERRCVTLKDRFTELASRPA